MSQLWNIHHLPSQQRRSPSIYIYIPSSTDNRSSSARSNTFVKPTPSSTFSTSLSVRPGSKIYEERSRDIILDVLIECQFGEVRKRKDKRRRVRLQGNMYCADHEWWRTRSLHLSIRPISGLGFRIKLLLTSRSMCMSHCRICRWWLSYHCCLPIVVILSTCRHAACWSKLGWYYEFA